MCSSTRDQSSQSPAEMADHAQHRRGAQNILRIFGPDDEGEPPRHVCRSPSDWDHSTWEQLYGPDPHAPPRAHETPDGQEPQLMAEVVAAALKQAADIGKLTLTLVS